jgi:predicted nucleic acid-binding Zn ribbon protein
MEMCPYCGEDVPADTKTCWKCGTELSGGDASDGDEVTGDTESTIERRKKKVPTVECPYCNADVPPKALRCNSCGRPLKKTNRAPNWIKGAIVAFGAVVLAVVVGLIYAAATKPPPRDPERDNPLQQTYESLARIYLVPAGGGQEDKRRETWNSQCKGRYVSWDGFITNIDAEQGWVEVSSKTTATVDQPEVRIQFGADAILAGGLKKGRSIAYNAQLDDYDPTAKVLILIHGELSE